MKRHILLFIFFQCFSWSLFFSKDYLFRSFKTEKKSEKYMEEPKSNPPSSELHYPSYFAKHSQFSYINRSLFIPLSYYEDAN